MNKDKTRLDKYVNNAKEEDIEIIDVKIDKMNKGVIGKIWNNKVIPLYKFIKDPDASWAKKAIAVGALVYLISPIDAIPDIIPIVGYLDDIGVIAMAVNTLNSELNKYIAK